MMSVLESACCTDALSALPADAFKDEMSTRLGVTMPKAMISLTTGLEDPERVTLDKGNLIGNAEIGGTVPMWQWIGDDPAVTFSY
jgi:hypothetical protein